ncbi:hypothetical protein PR003_g2839 [Phytophthora rubi]|uniref:Secreted protein n=1 Tax=Phytophthora rubi TaxID=129364 RepID=A0A6A3P457_9STRA|nr:hypothetical protein PR002_g2671 [Phytophthora rubi]KAE9050267.1 hypothetical protein PR001_g2549 [Phytophthora rubi]KAE9355452.1 hypothetical protein PR003_g2839 [Phytophthora rubi]
MIFWAMILSLTVRTYTCRRAEQGLANSPTSQSPAGYPDRDAARSLRLLTTCHPREQCWQKNDLNIFIAYKNPKKYFFRFLFK